MNKVEHDAYLRIGKKTVLWGGFFLPCVYGGWSALRVSLKPTYNLQGLCLKGWPSFPYCQLILQLAFGRVTGLKNV